MPRRHRAASPAQPGRPHHVTRKVRATRDLRPSEQCPRAQHGPQRHARACSAVLAPQEVQAEEGERRDGVAGRKAVPRATVIEADCPVRHIRGCPAERREIPRAGRATEALDGGHQQQAPDGDTQPVQSLCTCGSVRCRSYRVKHESHQGHAGQQPAAVVQYLARPPDPTPCKAGAATIEARHRKVGAARLPSHHQGERREAHRNVSLDLAHQWPCCMPASCVRQSAATSHLRSYSEVRTSSKPSMV